MLCGYLSTQIIWKQPGQIYKEIGLPIKLLVTVGVVLLTRSWLSPAHAG